MKRIIICGLLLLLNIVMQAQNERTIEGGFASVDDIHKAMEQYDYESVIQNLPPMSGDTLFTRLRAQALKSMGRMSETLAEWNSLLPADSTNVKVIMELAECYFHTNEPYKRIDALKTQYKWDKHRVNYYHIAQIYDSEKDYANAIYYYEKYIALVPKEERILKDDNGNPIENSQTYYQLANKRIKKIKEEDFFRNGVEK